MSLTKTLQEMDVAVKNAILLNTGEDEGWFYDAHPVGEDENGFWVIDVYDEEGFFAGTL